MLFTVLLIISAVYGVLLGNYASTAYHRLPLRKPINGISRDIGIKPHCASCGTELKFWEYYPVLSWIFCRFKCNYCGAKIPMQYFHLEFSSMCISIASFLSLGMTVLYVFLTGFFVLMLLNAMLYYQYRLLFRKLVIFSSIILVIIFYIYIYA